MHTMKVEANKFKKIVVALLLLGYSYLVESILTNLSFDGCIIGGFILLIIPCYCFLLVETYTSKNKFGFMFLFLLLSLFFYYGQYFVIIAGFREELRKKYVSLICGRIEEQYVIKAFFIHVRALLMLFAGYTALIRSTPNERYTSDNGEESEVLIPSGYYIAAEVLFVVSAICQFVVLIYNMSIGNYLQLRSVDSEIYRFSSGNIMFYFGYFSKWFLPSSYMLLLKHAICNEKKRYRFVVAILFVYMFLYIQTGARFSILKALTALYIIHNNYVRRLEKRDLKWIIPIGIVGMVIFSVLSDIRAYGISVEGITSALKNSSPGYVFYDILSESGATAISLSNTLQYCPSSIPHTYFEFFLKMIANVLPSFLNPFYSISMTTTSAVFSPLLYGYTGSGYGSSFITEAYYYWGLWLYPVMILYGFIIGKLENVFDGIGTMKNITSIFGAVFLFSEMIYWVRNDIFEIGRSYIYCVVIPVFVINAISSAHKRQSS